MSGCPPRLVTAAGIGACAAAGALAAEWPDHPARGWMTALSLLGLAAPAVLAAAHWLGGRRALLALGSLSLYAYVVETVGLVTGWPYGVFQYGDRLGPRIGLVPAALPLGYVPLVLGALAVAWRLVGGRNSSERLRPLVWGAAAVFLLAFDLVLDPAAVAFGVWTYPAGGSYYGVPGQNFAGWLVTGLGAAWVGDLACGRPLTAPPSMLLSAAWILAFWTTIAASFGMVVPAVLGLILVLWLAEQLACWRSNRE